MEEKDDAIDDEFVAATDYMWVNCGEHWSAEKEAEKEAASIDQEVKITAPSSEDEKNLDEMGLRDKASAYRAMWKKNSGNNAISAKRNRTFRMPWPDNEDSFPKENEFKLLKSVWIDYSACRRADASRTGGQRPLDQALAEFEIVKKNEYVSTQAEEIAKDMCEEDDDTDQCGCTKENPCNDATSCSRRAAMMECTNKSCSLGKLCQNRQLQRLSGRPGSIDILKSDDGLELRDTGEKGFGIFANRPFEPNELIGEYLGQIYTESEFLQIKQQYRKLEKHTYCMRLGGGLVVDASRKGGKCRFLNHSCDPNSEAELWNVAGERRVAIVASKKIQMNQELTFDYAYGDASLAALEFKYCLCASKNCRQPPSTQDIAAEKNKNNHFQASDKIQTRRRRSRATALEGDVDQQALADQEEFAFQNAIAASLTEGDMRPENDNDVCLPFVEKPPSPNYDSSDDSDDAFINYHSYRQENKRKRSCRIKRKSNYSDDSDDDHHDKKKKKTRQKNKKSSQDDFKDDVSIDDDDVEEIQDSDEDNAIDESEGRVAQLPKFKPLIPKKKHDHSVLSNTSSSPSENMPKQEESMQKSPSIDHAPLQVTRPIVPKPIIPRSRSNPLCEKFLSLANKETVAPVYTTVNSNAPTLPRRPTDPRKRKSRTPPAPSSIGGLSSLLVSTAVDLESQQAREHEKKKKKEEKPNTATNGHHSDTGNSQDQPEVKTAKDWLEEKYQKGKKKTMPQNGTTLLLPPDTFCDDDLPPRPSKAPQVNSNKVQAQVTTQFPLDTFCDDDNKKIASEQSKNELTNIAHIQEPIRKGSLLDTFCDDDDDRRLVNQRAKVNTPVVQAPKPVNMRSPLDSFCDDDPNQRAVKPFSNGHVSPIDHKPLLKRSPLDSCDDDDDRRSPMIVNKRPKAIESKSASRERYCAPPVHKSIPSPRQSYCDDRNRNRSSQSSSRAPYQDRPFAYRSHDYVPQHTSRESRERRDLYLPEAKRRRDSHHHHNQRHDYFDKVDTRNKKLRSHSPPRRR